MFHVYNTVFLLLYKLMCLPTNCNHSADPFIHSVPVPSPLLTTTLFSVSLCLCVCLCLVYSFILRILFFFNSTFECNQMVFVFFWLSVSPSSSIHVAANGKSSSFLWLSSISLCMFVCMCTNNIFIHLLIDRHRLFLYLGYYK